MKSGHQGSLSRHHGKSGFPGDGSDGRPAKKRRKLRSASSQLGSIDNQRTVERTPGPCAARADRIVHVLDFSRIEVYEAGDSLVTVLAYVVVSDARSADIHASLVHRGLTALSVFHL